MSEEKPKCTHPVWVGFRSRRCKHDVWRNGFCKQHHPETVRARRIARDNRWEERKKENPLFQLREARRKIEELEAEVIRLNRELEKERDKQVQI